MGKIKDKKELIKTSSHKSGKNIAVTMSWLAHQYLSTGCLFIQPDRATPSSSFLADYFSHVRFFKTI